MVLSKLRPVLFPGTISIFLSLFLLFVVLASSAQLTAQNKGVDTLQLLTSKIDSLKARTTKVEEAIKLNKKDAWDKIGVFMPLVSGLLVAAMGFYATNVYNKRQLDAEESRKDSQLLVEQVQTVEKFIPHLSSGREASKKAALLAIAALGKPELAISLAKIYGGRGSFSALTSLAQTESMQVADAASRALADLFEYLKSIVVTIHEKEERRASGFVATRSGLIVTAAHAISGISTKEINVRLPDGTLAATSLLTLNDKLDLALLRCTTKSIHGVDIEQSEIDLGDKVVALMISVLGDLDAVVGYVRNAKTRQQLAAYANTMIQNNNAIVVAFNSIPGSSGSPVIDETGKLVGIIQGSDEEVTILISADNVIKFVREYESILAV